MKLFKYKKLYNIELENRKAYEKRYREIKKENEDLQVQKGYAELQQKVDKFIKANFDLNAEIFYLKEELAKVKIELEDTQGFLKQEKECSNALRKERTKLRKELKEAKNGK